MFKKAFEPGILCGADVAVIICKINRFYTYLQIHRLKIVATVDGASCKFTFLLESDTGMLIQIANYVFTAGKYAPKTLRISKIKIVCGGTADERLKGEYT